MNPKSKQTKSQALASRLALARLQQIRAKRNLEDAKERARQAKRKRKEAKQAFRRARQEVKRTKIELANTEALIVETEVKLAKATKVQAKRYSNAKRRLKAHARQARPARLPGKAATPRSRKGVSRKDQLPSIPQAAELLPANGLVPESDQREVSPSVAQKN